VVVDDRPLSRWAVASFVLGLSTVPLYLFAAVVAANTFMDPTVATLSAALFAVLAPLGSGWVAVHELDERRGRWMALTGIIISIGWLTLLLFSLAYVRTTGGTGR